MSLLGAYRLLGDTAGSLIEAYLDRRLRQGKEDPARLPERMGIASRPRPPGVLVWLHAASVGEATSALALVDALLAQRPDLTLLVTTGTVTSAALLAGRLPPRALHHYVPVDRREWVERFLDHWRPDLALWIESELWPMLIVETDRRGIPMVLINARMSRKSARSWRFLPGLALDVLGRFDLCLARSIEQAERFRRLGAPTVRVPGNLKFAATPLPADPAALAELRAMIGDRPHWLAASTHDGEEQAAIAAHRAAAARHPDLLTLIMPRHPKRGAAVASLASEAGLTVARRALGQAPTPETAIYVADTLGEMGLFLASSPIVFVGGSLAPKGGHNPLEAAHFGCAILHGPDMRNNAEMAEALQADQAALCVTDAAALKAAIGRLLDDPAEQARLAEAAANVAERNAGVLDRVMAELANFLNALPPQKPENARA
ncbi:MAG: 3-deoxy-D-manno-octulosonic acid transferase [Alphaproteobacteria bacterium]|nr:3-deoxy-D-manno-octulosonic acid transferase [Alphaproteobacteria bacterium]MBU0797458.1 3-deoxy-D-manno-octulosonic acid transferase [Alphaproteobacteria bacterium]MBU0888577.1 3-deoxy-D-manno-octulosonic acid transferase [Alphaproteobacteria bacterium]MBU1813689.1 3-deoxy-D-manno-octulosonic acid transferase [Alphaproteobacteria bacterium]